MLARSVENTHWHQPVYLIFDSETMPKWFGMPKDEDLPSTFSIECLFRCEDLRAVWFVDSGVIKFYDARRKPLREIRLWDQANRAA